MAFRPRVPFAFTLSSVGPQSLTAYHTSKRTIKPLNLSPEQAPKIIGLSRCSIFQCAEALCLVGGLGLPLSALALTPLSNPFLFLSDTKVILITLRCILKDINKCKQTFNTLLSYI